MAVSLDVMPPLAITKRGRAPTSRTVSTSAAETVVKRFYDSLSDAQRQTIVLPFDHELRQKISANWHVTKPVLDDDFYTDQQRALVDEIIRKVTSEDGYQRIVRQTKDDAGGIGGYSIAVFGTPGGSKFEWELTGRHLTLRADGDSVDKMAFGGPIIYGHGNSEPGTNVFHYQTRKANEVFTALDGKQREKALLSDAPRESEVPLQGKDARFPGIAVGELSGDQKELVESVIKVILAPYREKDVDEALAILKAGRVLQEAAPREAYDRPASLDVAAALGMINVHDGRVENGALATPFGALRAHGFATGAAARAVVRAEALRLAPGSGARVLSVRPHGAHDLVRIEAEGAIWRALTPARTPLGETVAVEIEPAGAFVFAA